MSNFINKDVFMPIAQNASASSNGFEMPIYPSNDAFVASGNVQGSRPKLEECPETDLDKKVNWYIKNYGLNVELRRVKGSCI